MTTKNIKRTKRYKELVAVGVAPDAAIAILQPVLVTEDPRIAQLQKAGLSPEQITAALGQVTTAPVVEVEVEHVLSPADIAEALVAERGLTFTKGRVYLNAEVAKGVTRVLKTGTPEIVKTSEVGRTVAVVLFPTESGDVAVQNLATPAK